MGGEQKDQPSEQEQKVPVESTDKQLSDTDQEENKVDQHSDQEQKVPVESTDQEENKGDKSTEETSTPDKSTDLDEKLLEPPSELEQKIIRQVEYYFGDVNLPRDRFMQEYIQQDDGWLTLETMLKFKRLQQLSEDMDVIANALKKSTTKLMEVSADNKKIRRSPDHAMPENTKERRDEMLEKTVYAKGFPLDVTLDQLMAHFGQIGKVLNIFMKTTVEKKFKGSVYVTFSELSDAVKFLEEDQKYGECEITKLKKKEYFEKKAKEIAEQKEEKKRKRIEDEQKKLEDEMQKMKAQITHGAVVELSGIKQDTNREDIKNYFTDFGNVAWVDYETGETKAKVRFSGSDLAAAVLEKVKEANEGKIIINTAEIETKILEGEEELEHWQDIFRHKADSQQRQRGSSYKKFRGRGGKYQGKRNRNDESRVSNRNGDQPSEKKQKVD